MLRFVDKLLPPHGPVRRYCLVSLIDATGTGLFLAVSSLYFVRVAGFSATEVGLGLSLAGLFAMIGAIPLGSLGDKLGHLRVWVILTLLQALAYGSYPFVHAFPSFVAAVTLAALCQVGSSSISGAYLSHMAGDDQRVRARAFSLAFYNVGFAIGGIGAGVALHIGSRAAYNVLVLSNAASYLICAIVLLTLPRVPRTQSPRRRHLGVAIRDLRFLTVAILNGLLMTYGAILVVALPLWIVQRTSAPRWTVAAVFLLNTFLAATLQVRAARSSNTIAGASRAIRSAGGFILAACIVLSVSGLMSSAIATGTIAVGCVLMTCGEIRQSAGAFGISYGLAPPARTGEYLAVFALGTRVYDTIGPILVVGMILDIGIIGWILLGLALFAIAHLLGPAALAAERHAQGAAAELSASAREPSSDQSSPAR